VSHRVPLVLFVVVALAASLGAQAKERPARAADTTTTRPTKCVDFNCTSTKPTPTATASSTTGTNRPASTTPSANTSTTKAPGTQKSSGSVIMPVVATALVLVLGVVVVLMLFKKQLPCLRGQRPHPRAPGGDMTRRMIDDVDDEDMVVFSKGESHNAEQARYAHNVVLSNDQEEEDLFEA